MTSLRLVGAGFLLALALLPAMLLDLASTASAAADHADPAITAVAVANSTGPARRSTSLDDQPRKPWEGASSAGRPAEPRPATTAAMPGTPVVELYLPTPIAAQAAAELLADSPDSVPRPLVVCFGAATDKDAAPEDVDPFVAVEAGRRRRAYARAMIDQRAAPGPVAILSSSLAETPAAGDATGLRDALARAAADPAGAKLELKLARPDPKTAAAGAVRVEFKAAPPDPARAAKPADKPRLSDDVVLILALVEDVPLGAGNSAAQSKARLARVLTMKSFKLSRDGLGAADLSAPTPPARPSSADTPQRARRVIGYLQHGKTMRVLAAAESEPLH
ncbi:MAG: hypothetical protein KF869_00435 [Phycisphaeraceae bacterium]|nr:hypothetical protein [Phycisphaeraceae bacterium]